MVFKISLKTFSLPATTLPVSKYLSRPEKSPIKPLWLQVAWMVFGRLSLTFGTSLLVHFWLKKPVALLAIFQVAINVKRRTDYFIQRLISLKINKIK
jgi:hypothetical protein